MSNSRGSTDPLLPGVERLRRLNDRLAVSLTLALESLRAHCPNTSPERIDARKALDEWAAYNADAIHAAAFGDPFGFDEQERVQ